MNEVRANLVPQVLIVDDEKKIQDMLSRHFRFLGYGVEVAGDGVQALEIMAGKRCDVVISDIKMPRMDGIQLLRLIRSQYPMTHCIMMTGYVSMGNILECMRHGAQTCVYKPFEEITELEQAVSEAVKRILHWQQKLKDLFALKPKDGQEIEEEELSNRQK